MPKRPSSGMLSDTTPADGGAETRACPTATWNIRTSPRLQARAAAWKPRDRSASMVTNSAAKGSS